MEFLAILLWGALPTYGAWLQFYRVDDDNKRFQHAAVVGYGTWILYVVLLLAVGAKGEVIAVVLWIPYMIAALAVWIYFDITGGDRNVYLSTKRDLKQANKDVGHVLQRHALADFKPASVYVPQFMFRFNERCRSAGIQLDDMMISIITKIVRQSYLREILDKPAFDTDAFLADRKSKESRLTPTGTLSVDLDRYQQRLANPTLTLNTFESLLSDCFFTYARSVPLVQDGKQTEEIPFLELPGYWVARHAIVATFDISFGTPPKPFSLRHLDSALPGAYPHYDPTNAAAIGDDEDQFKHGRDRLYGTPFYDLFNRNFLVSTDEDEDDTSKTHQLITSLKAPRLAHQFILAPSGTGKTQLLQAQIVDDIQKVLWGEASLIVIDSQGVNRRKTDRPNIIENLISLKVFEGTDKLVYIKPDKNLQLSFFDTGHDDPKLSEEEREIRLTAAREMVTTSLGAATDLQHQMLSWCIRLAMLTDRPSIRTLRRILTTEKKDFPIVFGEALAKAGETTRDYFETFHQGPRVSTKDSLVTRVDGLIGNDIFIAMADAPRNEFQMIDLIENSKVIVVDADKARLGGLGAEAFGRFFVSQLLHASRQRQSTKPVYCYIDECHDFVSNDENIASLLTQARKQDIGLILATPTLSLINSPKVRETLQDVAIVVRATEHAPAGAFDISIRGVTRGEPVQITVPPRVMESMPRIDQGAPAAPRTPTLRGYKKSDIKAVKKKKPPAAPPQASKMKATRPLKDDGVIH